MKIIFSTYEAKEIGGSYIRSLSIAQGLAKLGHDLTLWTSAKNFSLIPKFSHEKNVLVIESIGLLPYRFRKGGYDPFDLIFRSLFILFSKCDIIQSFNHRPASTFPALIKTFFCRKTKWFLDWADLWGKGGIADRRNGYLSFLTKNIDHYMEQMFVKLPFAVTAISDDLLKRARKIRNTKARIYFLPIGVDIDFIKPLAKDKSRKKLGLPKKDFLLLYLYVGTYDEKLLLEIFIELKKIRNDFSLVMLGPKLDSFIHEDRAINLGVTSRESLPSYLAAADIMLLPFSNKKINLGRCPNKLGDYLAAGRPIIANPTGEVKKILQGQKAGLFVPESAKLFAKKIDDLLNQPEKMLEFGINARLLGEKLSWFSVAKQLEGFYSK